MSDIFIDKTLYHYFEKNPLRLVDVGASGGIENNWKSTKKYLNIIGFEPDPENMKI